MKDKMHIGTIELVSFPDEGIKGVPAKVDTGADSSSIWASAISETDNILSFQLFGINSPFYTGKTVETTDYSVISVKNSFGQTEFRYKTKLRVTIAGRTIKANFTLANRENNRYPVLIGRRTLSGKFVVDVTKRPDKGTRRVLMLSSKHTPVTAQYAENLTKLGKDIEVTYKTYGDLRFMIGPDGTHVALRDSGEDITNFDMVYFKVIAGHQDVAAAAAQYLDQRGIPYIDPVVKNYASTSKLYHYVVVNGRGLVMPKSVFLMPAAMAESYNYLVEELGLPFVLKDIYGNRGEHNYLVRDEASFEEAIALSGQDDTRCIAQAYVENDGDYRVLVFGSHVELVIHRQGQSADSHLNNTSQGGAATLVSEKVLPPEIRTACVTAAKLLDRQIAGVDIVEDKNSGVWYCLEVNDGPQLASGSFTAEKHKAFAAYLERKLSK
jgi:glutathione synthase/RimK-type ligase-like ATP-grasp enzyme